MANDIVNLDNVKLFQTISFKTYNSYDTVEWKGVVNGIGGYDLVSKFEDLLPYHQNVKKSHPNIPELKDCTFLIIGAYENADTETTHRRIFAKEWIDESTVKIVDVNQKLDFRVYNVTEIDKQKIMDIMSDNGYSISFLSY